jgi:transcriptional regulator PpsR
MNVVGIAQPDVTITLDLDGVIRDVTVSNTLSRQDVSAWIGRPWTETVADTGDRKVRRMVEDAVRRQVSAFRQVTQRFPSGLELLMEYTTIRLGEHGGLIAVGKSLQAVTELQSRLLSAQQEMEREFWKLRELETRYRLLFDNSSSSAPPTCASSKRIRRQCERWACRPSGNRASPVVIS